jgi:hypothetical protein
VDQRIRHTTAFAAQAAKSLFVCALDYLITFYVERKAPGAVRCRALMAVIKET